MAFGSNRMLPGEVPVRRVGKKRERGQGDIPRMVSGRGWWPDRVPAAPCAGQCRTDCRSQPPTHPRSPGFRQGRIAAIAMVAASPAGTSQIPAIVIGNRIRSRMHAPAQAAGHAGKSYPEGRDAVLPQRGQRRDRQSQRRTGGATRLDQNRGCPNPKPPGDNHHHARASRPCPISSVSQYIRQDPPHRPTPVSSPTIPRPFRSAPPDESSRRNRRRSLPCAGSVVAAVCRRSPIVLCSSDIIRNEEFRIFPRSLRARILYY